MLTHPLYEASPPNSENEGLTTAASRCPRTLNKLASAILNEQTMLIHTMKISLTICVLVALALAAASPSNAPPAHTITVDRNTTPPATVGLATSTVLVTDIVLATSTVLVTSTVLATSTVRATITVLRKSPVPITERPDSRELQDHMTISVVNRYASPVFLSLGSNVGAPSPVGNPSAAALPRASHTKYTFPTGWA